MNISSFEITGLRLICLVGLILFPRAFQASNGFNGHFSFRSALSNRRLQRRTLKFDSRCPKKQSFFLNKFQENRSKTYAVTEPFSFLQNNGYDVIMIQQAAPNAQKRIEVLRWIYEASFVYFNPVVLVKRRIVLKKVKNLTFAIFMEITVVLTVRTIPQKVLNQLI